MAALEENKSSRSGRSQTVSTESDDNRQYMNIHNTHQDYTNSPSKGSIREKISNANSVTASYKGSLQQHPLTSHQSSQRSLRSISNQQFHSVQPPFRNSKMDSFLNNPQHLSWNIGGNLKKELDELEEYMKDDKKDEGSYQLSSPNFAQNASDINSGIKKGPSQFNVNIPQMVRNSVDMNCRNILNTQNHMNSARSNSSLSRKKIFDPVSPAVTSQTISQLVKSKQLQQQQQSQQNNLPLPLSSSRVHNINNNNYNKENISMSSNLMNNCNINSNSSNNNIYKQNQDEKSFSNNSGMNNYCSFQSVNDIGKAKEKIKELENNLRKEILNSEEQRSLNSILKQELEKNLQDNGFMNFFKTNNSSSQLSHIDIYLELQVIKQKLLEKEEKLQEVLSINKQTQERLAINEISNKSIESENGMLTSQNKQLSEQLETEQIKYEEERIKYEEISIKYLDIKNKYSEIYDNYSELSAKFLRLQGEQENIRRELESIDKEEIDDLKAEKHNLIEFVEKMKVEQERLEEELSESEKNLKLLSQKYENELRNREQETHTRQNQLELELKNKNEQIHKQMKQIQDVELVLKERDTESKEQLRQIREKDIQNKELNGNIKDLQNAIKENDIHIRQLNLDIKDKNEFTRDSSNQMQQLSNDLHKLEEALHKKDEIITKCEERLKKLEENNKKISVESEKKTERLDQIRQLKEEIEKHRSSLIEENERLKSQLNERADSRESNAFIKAQFETYKQKFEDAKDNIFTLTQTLEETNQQTQEYKTKFTQIQQSLTEEQNINNQLKDSLKELMNINQGLERQIEVQKKKGVDEGRDQKERDKFTSERRSFQLQLEHQKSQNIMLEDKIEELEAQVESMRQKLDQNSVYYDKKMKDMKAQLQNRKQEQVGMQVQSALVADTIRQLSSYIEVQFIRDLELGGLMEDLHCNFEQLTLMMPFIPNTQFQSNMSNCQISNRSNSCNSNANSQFSTRSKELEELRSILTQKDRELQLMKREQTENSQYLSNVQMQRGNDRVLGITKLSQLQQHQQQQQLDSNFNSKSTSKNYYS